MSNTTKDFITTVMLLTVVAGTVILFTDVDKSAYLYTILCTLFGYTVCLVFHRKAINNEKH